MFLLLAVHIAVKPNPSFTTKMVSGV